MYIWNNEFQILNKFIEVAILPPFYITMLHHSEVSDDEFSFS